MSTVIREPQRILLAYSAEGNRRHVTTIAAGDEVPRQLYYNGRVYTTLMSMSVTTERTQFAARWVEG